MHTPPPIREHSLLVCTMSCAQQEKSLRLCLRRATATTRHSPSTLRPCRGWRYRTATEMPRRHSATSSVYVTAGKHFNRKHKLLLIDDHHHAPPDHSHIVHCITPSPPTATSPNTTAAVLFSHLSPRCAASSPLDVRTGPRYSDACHPRCQGQHNHNQRAIRRHAAGEIPVARLGRRKLVRGVRHPLTGASDT